MSGADNALAVSITPWKRSLLVTFDTSRSDIEAGRLRRDRRSAARLFRLESMDSMLQTPATNAANTSSGINSANPTMANSTVHSPGSGVRGQESGVSQHDPAPAT